MAIPQKTLLALALLSGGVGALAVFPPELLRVGASYSAKMVCSNVFLANRKVDDIVRDDLQAPGHPLLKLIRVQVDHSQGVVRAGFLGFLGKGLAVYRTGTGCAAVPDGNLHAAAQVTAKLTDLPTPNPALAWPTGSHAEPVASVEQVISQSTLHGPGARAVVVIHQGKLIAQYYGPGFSASTRLLGWSMTKSVTAALIGIRIADGELFLDRASFWPSPSAGKEQISLGDLLSMQDGLLFNEEYGAVSDVTRMLYLEPDMAAFLKARPVAHPPRTVWNYSSGTTVFLSQLWQQSVGSGSLAFPQQRLFAPLGMSSAVLEADARGTLVGSSYLYATAQDWARFGQFLLQDGVWNGQRILPAGYVQHITTATELSKGQYGRGQIWRVGPGRDDDPTKNPDAENGLPSDTFWLAGHDGQTVAVMPSKQLVVVRMGLTPSALRYRPQAMIAAILKALP